MILGAWQVLVLVGTGAAYQGLIRKGEGSVVALLGAIGCFGVAAIGSLNLETRWTTSSESGIAILCLLGASIATIGLVAAITSTGPYASDRDDSGNFGTNPDSDYLDDITRRLS